MVSSPDPSSSSLLGFHHKLGQVQVQRRSTLERGNPCESATASITFSKLTSFSLPLSQHLNLTSRYFSAIQSNEPPSNQLQTPKVKLEEL